MKIILASLFLICTISNTVDLPFGGNAWATTYGYIDQYGYNFDEYNSVVTAYVYIGSSTPNALVSISLSNSAQIYLEVTIGTNKIKKGVAAS